MSYHNSIAKMDKLDQHSSFNDRLLPFKSQELNKVRRVGSVDYSTEEIGYNMDMMRTSSSLYDQRPISLTFTKKSNRVSRDQYKSISSSFSRVSMNVQKDEIDLSMYQISQNLIHFFDSGLANMLKGKLMSLSLGVIVSQDSEEARAAFLNVYEVF